MVGLTGGIGAGKSVVATRLAGLGAVVIDADRIAREVVGPGTDGLTEVLAAFGERVLDADGGLDRAALGEIVFGDDAARRRLEAIIHPRVRVRTSQLAARAAPDAVVVNDVPLLVEVGLAPTYHLVVVVQAAPDVRADRLVRGRGMTTEQAYGRIRAQASDAQREAAADVVLTNDGDLADVHAAVDTLWRGRLVPYERNLRERRPVRPARALPAAADPTWPAQFARLAGRIRHAVDGGPRIDHIGPTAVPGLPAADVIDIQLGVASLAQADALADRLADAGFPRCPGPGRDARDPVGGAERGDERLHGGADPARPVNLHLRVNGSPGWRYALLARDYLRAGPRQRVGYLEDERSPAAHRPDHARYGAATKTYLHEEHLRAEQWAASTGWQP